MNKKHKKMNKIHKKMKKTIENDPKNEKSRARDDNQTRS